VQRLYYQWACVKEIKERTQEGEEREREKESQKKKKQKSEAVTHYPQKELNQGCTWWHADSSITSSWYGAMRTIGKEKVRDNGFRAHEIQRWKSQNWRWLL
jgi:hypothetical protein